MESTSKKSRVFKFGEFELSETPGTLKRNGKLIKVSTKALKVLVVLLESPGEVVGRNDLIERVWTDASVEEANLTVAISKLRAVFKDREGAEIRTVPRVGYQFIGSPKLLLSEQIQTGSQVRTEISPDKSEKTKPLYRLVAMAATIAALFIASSFAVWKGPETFGVFNPFAVENRKIDSLAVIPFTADSQASGLSKGLAANLVNRLGKLNRFAVRPVGTEKGSDDPVAKGKSLEADVVLVGTIISGDKNYRVFARLIDVRDSATVWTGTFDQPKNELLKMQDQMAYQVAHSISKKITQSDVERTARQYTKNNDAFEAYIHGMHIALKRLGDKRCLDYFDKAIEIDPDVFCGLSRES